jgi:hypothetical protein
MAVVTSFTHDGVALIPPSDLVTFTDTSTGSPDRWYWDFGDGEYSELQHPTHTFYGEATDVYTVTLKSWIAGTETAVARSDQREFTNQPSVAQEQTNHAAFDLWESWGYGPNSPQCGAFMVKQNDPDPENAGYLYLGNGYNWDQNISALGTNGVMIVLRVTPLDYHAPLNRSIGTRAGQLKITVAGVLVHTVSSGAAVDVEYTAGDVTDLVAGTGLHEVSMWAIPALLPAQWNESQGSPPYDQTGIIAQFDIIVLNTTDPENLDETSQELMFGVAPVANFTGSPLQGANPLDVQFENLTTEAIGLPTTYQWLKKLSGTEDEYEEFSTEENPLESFDKG